MPRIMRNRRSPIGFETIREVAEGLVADHRASAVRSATEVGRIMRELGIDVERSHDQVVPASVTVWCHEAYPGTGFHSHASAAVPLREHAAKRRRRLARAVAATMLHHVLAQALSGEQKPDEEGFEFSFAEPQARFSQSALDHRAMVVQADVFASTLLMPEDRVHELAGEGSRRAALRLGVAESDLRHRMTLLGIGDR